jgi:hypothetical protein
VTLSGGPSPDKIELPPGIPLNVYFEVPEGYPDTAWIGQIPVTVTSALNSDNVAAKLDSRKLEGVTKGSFAFKLITPGTYVFRLFSSDDPEATFVAESQAVTITPPPTAAQ